MKLCLVAFGLISVLCIAESASISGSALPNFEKIARPAFSRYEANGRPGEKRAFLSSRRLASADDLSCEYVLSGSITCEDYQTLMCLTSTDDFVAYTLEDGGTCPSTAPIVGCCVPLDDSSTTTPITDTNGGGGGSGGGGGGGGGCDYSCQQSKQGVVNSQIGQQYVSSNTLTGLQQTTGVMYG